MVGGRFIAIEGGEGVGKTTQIQFLEQWLNSLDHDVITTREPGGTEGAEAIRSLLLSGSADKWNAVTEALLFAAARADHVAKLIRPALHKGQWVITDRFIDSSRAYQSGASGLSDDDILTLHHIGSDGLLPDHVIILTLDENLAAQRVAQRDQSGTDRIGARNQGFHRRVASAFLGYARAAPERYTVIDAGGSAAQVHERIKTALIEAELVTP